MTETSSENREGQQEMSFLDHLEILRWHIIRSLLAIVAFGILAFVFSRFIFDYIILAPRTPEFITNIKLCDFGNWIGSKALCINSKPFNIISIKMAGQFSAHITTSIVAGFIVGFPYVFWEFWRFIEPALYENERKQTRGAVFWSSILFLMGVLFGYFLITPLSVHFLGSYETSSQVQNQINLGSYISTVTSVVIASGVIFELPILIYFLAKAGLVTPDFLKRYRRHSLIIILMLSAVITPPDVFSQILVSVPLLILYEAGIIIAKNIERKDKELLV